MTRALAAACAAAVLAVCGSASRAAGPAPDPRLLSGERDEIVQRAPVPGPENPQGEVRLVRRGDAAVMQTVLHTRALSRVVAAIRKKETSVWPAGRPGHGDSRRYVDALAAAAGEVVARPSPGTRDDRRRALLIEFILSPEAALVAFAEPEVGEEGEGRLRVVSRRRIAELALSRRYIRDDMHEIAMDAFILDRKEAGRLLGPVLAPKPPGSPGETPSGRKGR